MDRKLWERIREVVLAASELEGEDRARYLDENCASPEERLEVEACLRSEAGISLLDTPPENGEHGVAVELERGERFAHYEIQELLGAGGGGKVYLAADTRLKRQVAIKVLPSTESSSRRRFFREAETASGLNHPNIVTVYELGTAQGLDYIAMEYIAGKTLRKAISKKGLPLAQFFPWAIQIADAIGAAHAVGIVHRDLKPGNVMISDRGIAKVVDFGLAKTVEAPQGSPEETLTRTGMLVGTCAYMAPEQAEGKHVDARTDIFALGCVFYEMLTGRPAFTGDSQINIIANVLNQEPAPIAGPAAGLPAALVELIQRCMCKNPAERWQNAIDIGHVLRQIQSTWENQQSQAKAVTRGTLLRVAIGLAIGSAAALAFGYWQWYRKPPPPALDYRVVALTNDTGLSTAPALSKDGRLLVYASDRAGRGDLDIWLQQIGGHEPVRLTRDEADETDPDISPDGTRVVFRSEKEGGGIFTMPTLGGEAVLLMQGARNPRFSPDGRWIAYWTGREGGSVLFPGSAQAFIIPTGGGEPRQIGKDLQAGSFPVWSPDSKAVLALGRHTADLRVERSPDWYIIPLDASPATNTGALSALRATITPPAWRFHLVPLLWDGQTVYFSGRRGDAVNLWSATLDARSRRLSGNPVRLSSGMSTDTHLAAAGPVTAGPLVVSSANLQVDLWSIAIGSADPATRLRRITADLSPEFYASTSWDGSTVAYLTRRGNRSRLCVRNLKTMRESILPVDDYEGLYPNLSGDGRWVVFTDEQGNIARVSSAGGAITRLCEKCGTPTYVSYDGAKVLFEPYDSPENIRLLDVVSGETKILAGGGPERLFDGELSRDGAWVVFLMRINPTESQLFITPVSEPALTNPSQWIAITERGANHQGPRWSPDGSAIYYRSDRDGFRCIWMRRIDPLTKRPIGPQTAVQHFHQTRWSLSYSARMDNLMRLNVGPHSVMVALGDITGNLWLREPVRK